MIPFHSFPFRVLVLSPLHHHALKGNLAGAYAENQPVIFGAQQADHQFV